MGLVTGIAKIAQKAYRYIRYGKQVGKTAKNGNKVYKRGGTTTGVDAKGKVIHRAQTVKTGKYSTETRIYKPLPFDGRKEITVRRDYEHGSIWSVSRTKDRFGLEKDRDRKIIYVSGNKKDGFHGCIDSSGRRIKEY